MADSVERSTLPIFPLAVVLLPGELLPLHVFEERYKALMNAALETDRRFGLSYVARAEVGQDSPPPAGSVGCVANITAVVPLQDGRMNMLTIGAGRYRIVGYAQHEPFLVAEIEAIEDEPSTDTGIEPLVEDVRALFGRLAGAVRRLGNEGEEASLPDLDVEPPALSFLVAANIALDNDAKQSLLEMRDTAARLDRVHARLVELVEAYEYRAEMHVRSKSNGHGKRVPAAPEE